MSQIENNGQELVFGLDIGTRSIVGTIGYKDGDRFVVVGQEIREHKTRAMLDGQIHDINRVAATLMEIRDALQKKTDFPLEEVCIAAAGRVLRTKDVHVDMNFEKERSVTREDLNTLVSMGVEKAFNDFQTENDTDIRFYCVGHSVVRYYLNGLWMGQPEHHKAKSIGADIIGTFLPDDVVDGLYSAVDLAGLKVVNLTLEPIAAIRVAIPEKFRLLNIAMLDIGAGTADISITDEGSVIAYGMIPHAGDVLTETLARTCLIDFATAEKIKTATTLQDKITYEDIMGLEQTITAEKVVEICRPQINKMAEMTAEAIVRLNGGTSPSAVFIVGGGGKIKGFSEKMAEALGLDPSRVALRGEEILRDVEFPEGCLKDSTIITPIGICLTYYDQNNNFIYITFNGERIKLYDNNKLAVVDAAMQASFTKDGLFPRRGRELHYTVNGKNRVKKGSYGEGAHIYVNGESVNINHNIRANDVIVIEESTVGADAQERISELIDYNGKIIITVNGRELQLPKPVKVNGQPQYADYLIQEGDAVSFYPYYTYSELIAYLGYSETDMENMTFRVNGKTVDKDTLIYAYDVVQIKSQGLSQVSQTAADGTADKAAVSKETAADTVTREPETVQTEAASEAGATAGAASASDTASSVSEPKTDDTTASASDTASSVSESKTDDTTASTSDTASSVSDTTAADTAPSTSETDRTTGTASSTSDTTPPASETDTASLRQTAGAEAGASGQSGAAEPEKKGAQAEDVFKNMMDDAFAEGKYEADGSRKLLVIVNQSPVVMTGKKSYCFVDIFDYIDFDTSKMQGTGIATIVNGRDAQYTQELHNGDKVEIYWKK